MTRPQEDLAIYMHWPFCQSKCPYCDFNSHVAASIDHDVWREAYKREIDYYGKLLGNRRITSIFFGGGTPSLMEAKTVELILCEIKKNWSLSDDVEITLEANPGSVEAKKFADFKAAGVNRLSLGVQSLYDDALRFLGRAHNAEEAKRAISVAGENFARFSFDLIYARKDQTLDLWQKELEEALLLSADHISLYQLTIEPNTQFYTLSNRGEKLTAPDEQSALMFEFTQRFLEKKGMPAYEISNHAKPGSESRHNLTYWHYKDYIGIGPGAHGRYLLDGKRFATEDHKAPDVWLRSVKEKGHGLRIADALDMETSKREALMMGLRLKKGISKKDWGNKFEDPLDNFLSASKVKKLIEEGYIKEDKTLFQATSSGLQRLNAVLGYLVG